MKAICLVEHVDRELDVACLARLKLKKRYGIDLEIANVSADAPQLLRKQQPKIVFFSSFYSSEWKLRKDYISAWPHAKYASLSWEQIFCPIDLKLHRPIDDFARQEVHYLAWSDDYRDFLIKNDVNPENISVIGHALYKLYDDPYLNYFNSRSALSKKFKLDRNKRWIFVPENYGFAFYSDEIIELIRCAFLLPDEFNKELRSLREYCRASLATLGRWTEALSSLDDVEVIFRPRPSVDRDRLAQFLGDEIGISNPRFHIIKEETARDWVIASDVVISSYSTVLIEASLANKTIRKVEPTPLPPSLRYEWCDLVTSVTNEDEMLAAASAGSHDGGSSMLRQWARRRFFPSDDPAVALVDEIARLTEAAYREVRDGTKGPWRQRVPTWLSLIDEFVGPRTRDKLYRNFVPDYTHKVTGHEKDFFDRADVHRRTNRWAKVLAGGVH
ncbi:hypothetical protein [Pseudorhodoplanes sp.]|uniref:hypothetical protein n=1 Tax=Pseudorhodoplanes sp. TaxID=1934341 RepID=UPI003D0D62C7